VAEARGAGALVARLPARNINLAIVLGTFMLLTLMWLVLMVNPAHYTHPPCPNIPSLLEYRGSWVPEPSTTSETASPTGGPWLADFFPRLRHFTSSTARDTSTAAATLSRSAAAKSSSSLVSTAAFTRCPDGIASSLPPKPPLSRRLMKTPLSRASLPSPGIWSRMHWQPPHTTSPRSEIRRIR
jgi:hypothetical protein